MPSHSLLLRSVALLTAVGRTLAFDRDVCLQSAQSMLGNGTLTPNSPYFYRRTPESPPYIDASNMTLTLAGCNAICGPRQTWYLDVGPRLSAWVIPVLLLLLNVEVGPFGKRNFLEYLHLLGDPIDSLWSLIHKIDAWNRCHVHAAQYQRLCPSCRLVVATVLAGYEEVQGPRFVWTPDSLDTLTDQFHLIDHFDEWRRAAVYLAGSRTDELVRTVLALILYLYQLVSNFVPAVGGVPSSPPGSRIATAVLLSCYAPAILLTNAVGAFTSRRAAYDAIANLAVKTNGQALKFAHRISFFLPWSSLFAQKSSSDYFDALIWSGGMYMYRPWKTRYITWTRSSTTYTIMCFCLAATPVLIGFIGGSLLLWWQTPRGFNCRHIWLITVSLSWITSAIATQVMYNHSFATGKYHWRFILIKDAFVAVPSFLMFFLSASGLFNSCWCWSGPWEYPGVGRVILPVTFYESNGTIMYPMTLGAALFLQILVVAGIVIFWRRGFRLLRWKGKILQEESDLVLGGATQCKCVSNIRKKLRVGGSSTDIGRELRRK